MISRPVAALFILLTICLAGFVRPDARAADDCANLANAVEQQKAVLLRETGQLKREIAALRQELTNPGLKDVAAGIGYIFGITGLALYFHSRKAKKPQD